MFVCLFSTNLLCGGCFLCFVCFQQTGGGFCFVWLLFTWFRKPKRTQNPTLPNHPPTPHPLRVTRGMIREASHRGPRGPHINNVAVLFCRFPYGCRFPIRLRFFHTTSNKSNDRVPEHSFRRKRGILKRVALTFVWFGGGFCFGE